MHSSYVHIFISWSFSHMHTYRRCYPTTRAWRHTVLDVGPPVSQLARIKGVFSCVAVSQLYTSSTPCISTVLMASDRQQSHFHLAVALLSNHPLPINVSLAQRKVFSSRLCWPDCETAPFSWCWEGFSSASEGTSAQQGFWQTDRVLTRSAVPEKLCFTFESFGWRDLIRTDVESASLDQGNSTGTLAVAATHPKDLKSCFLNQHLVIRFKNLGPCMRGI